ncbi:hypothetical protein DNU06_00875 [Putridiphycobacter roseus]|uniref:Uncharacterized protein n=1 Tax=Putridiphycobacter roseus TaxID=2219161 RepID=A0A2W1N1C8_9FLAO|nr:hypothetical protein [Putridiphycobacter roseus]PZE18419.1 hypothetical protein DNU06_00875 [Putridiphycobacter roseus]
MGNRNDIMGENRLMLPKRLILTYLLYFFIAQPFISFVFPDWGRGDRVFQMVEEEETLQKRFVEERVGLEVPSHIYSFRSTLETVLEKSNYFYLNTFYQRVNIEVFNPPPESLV